MAGPGGNPAHPVGGPPADGASPDQAFHRALAEAPHRYSFYQAVRKLEALRPDMPRVGESKKIAEDPVRLRQHPTLGFPPRTLEKFEAGEGAAPVLTENFFGLFGANGPLPHHLTEYALQRIEHHADHTFSRFADIFHHRLASLFYRAWLVHNQAACHDRPEHDRFAVFIASMAGLGMPSFCRRDAVQDNAKLHYSGFLACRHRHADGLKAILSQYFKVPVEILPFAGHWITVPREYLTQLGTRPDACRLGSTALVGGRVFDRQQKFRIQMGPMPLDDYKRFLPGGISFSRLVDWVRNYIGDHLEWDVELLLVAVEVPQTQLGKAGRVGWTTWPISKAQEKKQGSLILRPDGTQRVAGK